MNLHYDLREMEFEAIEKKDFVAAHVIGEIGSYYLQGGLSNHYILAVLARCKKRLEERS